MRAANEELVCKFDEAVTALAARRVEALKQVLVLQLKLLALAEALQVGMECEVLSG